MFFGSEVSTIPILLVSNLRVRTYWLHMLTWNSYGSACSWIFAIVVTLLVCTTPKHDPAYVFTYCENYSGWGNSDIAWCIGLLSTVYAFVGVETAAYFSEEIQHVSSVLPKASKSSHARGSYGPTPATSSGASRGGPKG